MLFKSEIGKKVWRANMNVVVFIFEFTIQYGIECTFFASICCIAVAQNRNWKGKTHRLQFPAVWAYYIFFYLYQFVDVPLKHPFIDHRYIYFLWTKSEWINKNVFILFRWLKTAFSNFPWHSMFLRWHFSLHNAPEERLHMATEETGKNHRQS